MNIEIFLQASLWSQCTLEHDTILSFRVDVRNESNSCWQSDLPHLPLVGWQVFALNSSTNATPIREGRIGEVLSLVVGEKISVESTCDIGILAPGDYLVRIDLVLENICWLHQCGGKACCHTFRISYPPTLEIVRNEEITYTIPIELNDTGYHIFTVSQHPDAKIAFPLLLRLENETIFDWDIPPGATYLWGKEAASGLARLSATVPAGSVEKVEHLRKAIGLKHAFQPDLGAHLEPTPTNTSHMIFYYPWFRTPMFDSVQDLCKGDWERHRWQLDNNRFTARRDIFPRPGFALQSSHWPIWGIHSSYSDYIIRQDMQFIASTGVGTIIVSWWPQGTVEDNNLCKILNIADDYGLKVCCLLEAFHNVHGQSADGYNEVLSLLSYLNDTHFQHKAYLRFASGPVLFEWGSSNPIYKPKWKETNRAFYEFKKTHPNGLTLVALHNENTQEASHNSIPDFYYTYEMHGVEDRKLPSRMSERGIWLGVGPGYDERCIPTVWRPEQRMTDRREGRLFDQVFSRAVKTKPRAIVIVSYNELAEGTCIMPTLPRRDMINNTERHFSTAPGIESQFAYLLRTKQWLETVTHPKSYPPQKKTTNTLYQMVKEILSD